MIKFSKILLPARKGLLLLLPLGLIATYCVHEASGHFLGIYNQSFYGCGGSGCHAPGPSGTTWVQVLPPSSPIEAGKTYTFQFLVWDELGWEKAAGCDITCDAGGTLDTIPNSGLGFPGAPLFPDLSHTRPKVLVHDSAIWSFLYTAPKKIGFTNIYAAGNAVHSATDSVNKPDSDFWNTTIYNVNVVTAGVDPIPSVLPVITLTPNPAHGTITLSDPELRGTAEVEISNEAGTIVSSETLIVGNSTPIDVRTLPNGTYFLTLRPRSGKAITERFVIQK